MPNKLKKHVEAIQQKKLRHRLNVGHEARFIIIKSRQVVLNKENKKKEKTQCEYWQYRPLLSSSVLHAVFSQLIQPFVPLCHFHSAFMSKSAACGVLPSGATRAQSCTAPASVTSVGDMAKLCRRVRAGPSVSTVAISDSTSVSDSLSARTMIR